MEKISENNFLGLPESISQEDMKYLKLKCETAVPILKNDWSVLLPKCRDFISLIDKQKVAFNLGVRQLNEILESGFFTSEEEKMIKKLRYQGRNNLAAKTMREKYRMKDEVVEKEIEELKHERLSLIQERENLIKIITSYKIAMAQERF